jgi:predicted SnoaL-like aldol condensation-catalyzing enzyme
MVDGPTQASDLDQTENNRAVVRSFVETVLISRQIAWLTDYIVDGTYTEHNPRLTDDVSTLSAALDAPHDGCKYGDYQHLHRVLAEGNFALCQSEGGLGGIHVAFYDLFRLANGKIVEHWDATEKIAPRSKWKNDNGKF